MPYNIVHLCKGCLCHAQRICPNLLYLSFLHKLQQNVLPLPICSVQCSSTKNFLDKILCLKSLLWNFWHPNLRQAMGMKIVDQNSGCTQFQFPTSFGKPSLVILGISRHIQLQIKKLSHLGNPSCNGPCFYEHAVHEEPTQGLWSGRRWH